MKLENISIKNMGIQVEGKWYNAKKVWAYASKLERGDEVNIKTDPTGKDIIFVEKLNANFRQPETKNNIRPMVRQDYADRQDAINEATRERRKIDWKMNCITNAIQLCIAGKISKEEIFEYTKGFYNFGEEMDKPVNFELKTEKLKEG